MKTSLVLLALSLSVNTFAASEVVCEKVFHTQSYESSEPGKINKRIKFLQSELRITVEVTQISTAAAQVGDRSAFETRCAILKY